MARKQKMTVETVLQQFDEDDGIDWENSDDEEDFEDDTVLNDIESDVDHLTLAQISDPVCEESMEISTHELDTSNPSTGTTTPTSIPVPSTGTTTPPSIPVPSTGTTTPTSIPVPSTGTTTTTTNNSPFSLPPFTKSVGPNVHLDSTSTAMDGFLLIFGEDTFQLLADQTNLYARQLPPGASYKWYDTSADEMKLFIGMILAMGVHRLPQLEDYWSSHPLLGAKGIVAGMSYRRFRVLLSCLHLVDNSTAVRRGDTGFDKLHKIRPLLDIIQQKIKSSYNPHQEVSIDEAMVGFKGRSSLKQYMLMKPTKRGFKIWCLCDSTNGYTYAIIIYTGASSATENGVLGPNIVIQLADPLLDNPFSFVSYQ